MEQVAYHCSILYEGGYIYDYKAQYGGNGLYSLKFCLNKLTIFPSKNSKFWYTTK